MIVTSRSTRWLRRLYRPSACVVNLKICVRAIFIARNRAIKPRSTTHQRAVVYQRIAKRTKVDYDDPAPKLLEESDKLGYKLYHQYGLPTPEAIAEYDAFNDTIWYGKQDKEMVYKLIGFSTDTKVCDLFLMRDYQNGSIIGCNTIKRVSSNLATVCNSTNPEDDKAFNFTIRRTTVVDPATQGKGYGKIIRKYSRELDDLHTGSFGASMTDIQVKNVPSYNLQIKSGFAAVCQCDVAHYYRTDVSLVDELPIMAEKYDLSCIKTRTDDSFEQVLKLHQKYHADHGVVDLSVNPYEIGMEFPLYVVRGKPDGKILAVMQVMTQTFALKAPRAYQNKLINLAAKVHPGLRTGFPGMETEFGGSVLIPMYVDFGDASHNLVEAVRTLVTYCFAENNITFGTTSMSTKSPYRKFWNDNKERLSGKFGAMMSENEAANIMMKFSGLNERQEKRINEGPIVIKLPTTLNC